MLVKKLSIIMLAITLLAVNGCSQAEQPENMDKEQTDNTKIILYENTQVGLRVYETKNWVTNQEPTAEPFSVTFSNEHSKAILSVISNEKSFEEIKRELKVGAGKVIVLEEIGDYLAFQSERLESIRTDIYIEQIGARIGIITFMTPLKDYELSQDSIEAFKKNIELF
ncbi:MAG: hypothetical protein APF84_05915 [Gracilibacter sp. BRH_c7a]|nr:MAG: hypothetical protein APF84_05915 [Gracilibacter sp. BRH_c7a]